jgi:hypothetical protein
MLVVATLMPPFMARQRGITPSSQLVSNPSQPAAAPPSTAHGMASQPVSAIVTPARMAHRSSTLSLQPTRPGEQHLGRVSGEANDTSWTTYCSHQLRYRIPNPRNIHHPSDDNYFDRVDHRLRSNNHIYPVSRNLHCRRCHHCRHNKDKRCLPICHYRHIRGSGYQHHLDH